MLVSPDHRISLSDQQPVATAPALEAVFVGAAFADARPAAAVEARAAATALGFGNDPAMTGRPLAFASAAAFLDAFPGDDSWLSLAVQDYFAAGGQRAWVVRVEGDPGQPLDAYVSRAPAAAASLPETGVDIALQVPTAGLLVLPDLEHACLAGALPPPQVPAPPSAPPVFRPVAEFVNAPQAAAPLSAGAKPVRPYDVLTRVSTALAAQRPDMLLLFALPVGADQTLSVPQLITRTATYLCGDAQPGPDLPGLPRVQALAPLLRSLAGDIATPSGQVAGVLAAAAESDGIWRSIAGRALPLGPTPLRRIESMALEELRRLGVSALRFGAGGTLLDDDILALRDVPANAARRAGGTRRVMGWLLRSLQAFGEQLVFENVLDERVELILLDLFDELFRRGALVGQQVTDAVTITRRNPAPNAVEFDIAVNAAVALETIRLRFEDGSLTSSYAVAA